VPSVDHKLKDIIGQSSAIQALHAQIAELARFDSPGNIRVPTLLVQGETGTGKGLVARVAHHCGPRANGPFIDVNCAAIPETMIEAELFGFEAGAFTDAKRAKPGLFESASGGTLFLDEIDALTLQTQPKLLKVIEDKQVRRLGAVTDQYVDVKLIVATNADLLALVAEGRFREDLYQRLHFIAVTLPPLRERGQDVVVLAQHFLQRYAAAHRIRPKRLQADAERWLERQNWPGNVRELSQLIERAMLLHPREELAAEDLEQLCLSTLAAGPPAPSSAPAHAPPTDASPDESATLRQALSQTGGNVARAARLLGLTRSAMRYRMQRAGVQRLDADVVSPPASSASLPVRDQASSPSTSHTTSSALPIGWEQKPVTILVITVTWPAPWIEATTQGNPWTIIHRWEQELVDKAQGFEGVVIHQTSSLYVIAFGVPRSLERMPQRAVQAALAVRHLAADMLTDTRLGLTSVIRQTIHSGLVLWDSHSSSSTPHLFVLDDTLELPLRLLGHTQPGDILVSTAIAHQVEQLCELQPVELAIAVQPWDHIEAYQVVKLRPRHAPWVRQVGQNLSPFVGREQELSILDDRLARVETGQGQVVGLMGEAGIGKSRFVYEFRRRIQGRSFTYLSGACYAYSATTPYLPVMEVLRLNCGVTDTDDPDVVVAKIEHNLQELELPPEEWAPYLLYLLGTPVEFPRLQALSPQALKAGIFEALLQMSIRGSRRRPIIFEIEDCHWIDASSEEFLAALIDRLADVPILLLLTYRPEYRPVWVDKALTTQLNLMQLTLRESRRLINQVWHSRPLSDRLMQTVLAKADGNPLFLEELSRSVMGQPEHVALAIPDTVQALITTRIDQLSSGVKQLLQLAATIGQEVSWRLLQAITETTEAELADQLSQLQAGAFLYDISLYPERVYGFKHVLIQDVAYQLMHDSTRRQYHKRIAEVIATELHEVAAAQPELLAYHYTAADCHGQAVTYWQRAGRRAYERSSTVEAISHLSKGLDVLSQLPQSPEHLQTELQLQSTMGAACMAAKGYAAPEVEHAYTRAHELCQQVGDQRQLFPVLVGLWNFYFVRGVSQTAYELGEQLLTMAQHEHDPILQLRAHAALGTIQFHIGRLQQAHSHLNCGMDLYASQHSRSHAVQTPTVSCMAYAAWTLWQLGYPDQAVSQSQAALSLAHELSHPLSLVIALHFTGTVHQFRREAALAHEHTAQTMQLADEQGFPFWSASGRIVWGWARAMQGAAQEGIDHIHEGLVAFRATGAYIQLPSWLALLAEVYRPVNPAEGIHVSNRALEILERTGERYYEAELYRLKGELLLQASHLRESLEWTPEACFHHALEIARRQQAKAWELRAATSLARLWQQQGKYSKARALLAPVYAWFTQGLDTADLKDARALLEELHT
jgi:DNA-binding NtrC family response regulator/predicted ATPase